MSASHSVSSPDAQPTNRIAVQMYTLRRLATPLDALLGEIAAAGYAGIETFGPLTPPAAEMRALLETHGLQVVSAHVPLPWLQHDLANVLEWHRSVGNNTLIVPWLAPEDRPSDVTGWTEFGATLAAVAVHVRTEGMRLLYHNHDFEMASFEGRTALEYLLQGADRAAPGALGLELDLAWVVRGDVDPLPLLERMAGRVPRAHAKDVAAPGANRDEEGHADVGDGTLNWDALLPALRAAGVEWLVVEHDEPADALRTIRRSAAFLNGRW